MGLGLGIIDPVDIEGDKMEKMKESCGVVWVVVDGWVCILVIGLREVERGF